MRATPLCAVAACALAVAACRGAPDASMQVLEVAASGAARRAGLQAGDRLTSWERAGESGPLSSPFALFRVEIEQAPLGAVTLHGRRGWRTQSWTLPPGSWELEARPVLDEGVEAAAWGRLQAGRASLAARQPEAAARAFGDALSALAGRPDDQAIAADLAGDALWASGALAEAAPMLQRALDLRAAASPRSLALARSHHQLGRLARRRGDPAGAVPHLEAARAIREVEAPGSPELALVLHDLGAGFAPGAPSNRPTPSTPAPRRSWPARPGQPRPGGDPVGARHRRLVAQGLREGRGAAPPGAVAHRAPGAGRRRPRVRAQPAGCRDARAGRSRRRRGIPTARAGDLREDVAGRHRGGGLFQQPGKPRADAPALGRGRGLPPSGARDPRAPEAGEHRTWPRASTTSATRSRGAKTTRGAADLFARSLAIKRRTAPGSLTVGRDGAQPGRGSAGPVALRRGAAVLRGGARAPGAPGAGQRRSGDRLAFAGAHRPRRRAVRPTRSPSGAARSTSWTRSAASWPASTAPVSSRAMPSSTAIPRRCCWSADGAPTAFAIRERFHARALARAAGRTRPGGGSAAPPRRSTSRARARRSTRRRRCWRYGMLRRNAVLFVVRAAGDPGPPVTAVTLPFDEDTLRARVLAFRGLSSAAATHPRSSRRCSPRASVCTRTSSARPSARSREPTAC